MDLVYNFVKSNITRYMGILNVTSAKDIYLGNGYISLQINFTVPWSISGIYDINVAVTDRLGSIVSKIQTNFIEIINKTFITEFEL